MSNIPFGLALIDILDLIEEALLVKARVLFQFHFNYAGCPQRAVRVKKRVGYLFGRRRRVFILHRSHKWK